MNTKTLLIGGLVIIIAGGAFFLNGRTTTPVMQGAEPTPTYVGSMEKPKDAMVKDDGMMAKKSRYVDHSKTAFDAAKGKKRVYFFYASWCPTCKAANTELTENLDGIPQDVVLFKTDYDKEVELKKKYGITYQHTYVLVDENGDEVKKWNGGDLPELIANTK
jgi:thioredoxin 1